MKNRSLKCLAAAVLAGFGIGSASAGTVSSQFFAGFQQLSDNSAEYLMNSDGSICGSGGDCNVQVGDRLIGMLTIATIEQSGTTHNLGAGSGNNELTGVFDLTVQSATFLGGTSWSFTFGSTGATAVQLYEGSGATLNYERTDSGVGAQLARITALMATASDGSPWATFTIDPTVGWSAFSTAGDDIAALGAIPAPGNGGTFNLGLNIDTNNSGLTFTSVPCGLGPTQVTACGSGSLLGLGGVTTPFNLFDNVDFTVNTVPEPGTLALLGLSLLGLAIGGRRRYGK